MMDKENEDPKLEHKTMPILGSSSKESLKLNRRVSFAPEVTLHKIDFVPRRETIGYLPYSSSDGSDSSSGGDSNSEVPMSDDNNRVEQDKPNIHGTIEDADDVDEYGKEILNDSSDEELTDSFTKVKINSPEKLDISNDNDNRDNNNLDKDLNDNDNDNIENNDTTQVSPGKYKITTVIEDETDLEKLPKISIQSVEEDMEFTEPINLKYDNKSNNSEIKSSDVEDMEFTQPVKTSITLQTIEEDMEFTQPVKTPLSPIVNHAAPQPVEEDMEFTQPTNLTDNELSNDAIQTTINSPPHKHHEEEMEFTQPVNPRAQIETPIPKPILQPIEPNLDNPETVAVNDQEDMEFTQPVKSLSLPPSENDSSQPPSKPIESPTKLSKEPTPHFPDIQIPIPLELSNNRLSDVDEKVITSEPINKKRSNDFNDEPIHKLAKYDKVQLNNTPLDQVITSKIPLAEITNDSINDDDFEDDPNYTNVSLTQFLKDLGIQFLDDLQMNNSDVTFQLADYQTTINENDLKISDYVKANNKLLIYSLLNFSNLEMTKNINDGKNIYNTLDESIIVNNPKLFKEFYASNKEEQTTMTSTFLLIKEFSRSQAKKIFSNWRIQLIDNLILQLNDKIDNLKSDKLIYLNELKLINDQFNENFIKYQDVSNKLTKIKSFKQIYHNYSNEEIANIKVELIEIKNGIQKLNNQIEDKTDEIASINNLINTNYDKINDLTQEIDHKNKLMEENKNYEINEIKSLKLKFNILQNITGIKYAGKTDDTISFEFNDYQLQIDFHNIHQINISSLKNNFLNKWLNNILMNRFNQYIEDQQSTSSSTTTLFIASCKYLNVLMEKFKKIDLDIFKISCKFPIIPLDANHISFTIRYYTDMKINIQIDILEWDYSKIDAKFMILQPVTVFKSQITDTSPDHDTKLSNNEILSRLIKDIYKANDLLNSVKL